MVRKTLRQRELALLRKEEMLIASRTKNPRIPRRIRPRGGFSTFENVLPPSGSGTVVGRSNPRFRSGSEGNIVLSNVELVAGLTTSVAFTPFVVRVAPSAVPWLNGVASNFSKWRWLKVRFIYIPQAPTSVSGVFDMGLQYDTQDANPVSTQAMSMYKGFVSSPVWGGWNGSSLLADDNLQPPPGSVVTTVDVRNFDKPWYPYSTTAVLDVIAATRQEGVNTYVPSYLIYASEGGPAVVVAAGQIFIQYEIELIEPIAVVSNN